jgi:hypothetical protein
MRKWWKKVGMLAGSLLGIGGILAPVQAQFGPIQRTGGGVFAGEPDPGTPADFPNPGKKGYDPVSPFSLRDDGAPNAFSEIEGQAPWRTYNLVFRAEYLLWWMSHYTLPGPLVTTSTANPLVNNAAGLLGEPDTTVLFNGGRQGYGAMSGGRVTMGLAPGFMLPMEVSGLFFNRNLTNFDVGSGGQFLLVRPVQQLNAPNQINAPAQAGFAIAGPGLGFGALKIDTRFNLWSTDVDMFCNFADNGTVMMDFIFGYKHTELNETIHFAEAYQIPGSPFANIPGGLPAGATANVIDDFAARNRFDGGTLGLRTRIGTGMFSLFSDLKVSMGRMHEILAVTGGSSATGGGGAIAAPGGILALNSNSGIVSRNHFAVLPEAGLSLSCQIYSNIRVFGGYNVLFLSHVVRPADQITTAIDTTQVPTDRNFVPNTTGVGPTRSFLTNSFFAHGVNLGLEIGF